MLFTNNLICIISRKNIKNEVACQGHILLPVRNQTIATFERITRKCQRVLLQRLR